jgi:hypothetical protein
MQDFSFRISQISACIVPRPAALPEGVDLRMTVDPAYFANDDSDCSAYAVGWLDDRSAMHLWDYACGRWRGLALPDHLVDAIELWQVPNVRIERNGNGAPDLLVDTIALRLRMKGLSAPRITTFVPRQPKRQKANRIARLQTLLDLDPPLLYIYRNAFTEELLQQAERFDFSADDNHRREDSLLDVAALACGF